jgi:hypothetical protein
MPRNEGKAKSGRKALKDLSNNNHGGRFSKSLNSKKKLSEKTNEDVSRAGEEDDALDRLLLVQTDLSSLVHQVTFQAKQREIPQHLFGFRES